MNNKNSDHRNYFLPSEQRMPAFEQYMRHYEINETLAKKLRALDGYEIVFICDDSGSMNTPISDVFGSYKNSPTRWDELKQIVSIVVDLASILDPDGVDIYFLNRDPMFNVRNSSELIPPFAVLPQGSTPLTRVIRQVLQNKKRQIQKRNLLMLIATDGIPTDELGHEDIASFRKVLKNERYPINRIPVTIIACTDDQQDLEYLNNWDKEIPNLDVVGDYRNEKKQILKYQGTDFRFTFGDYIVKTLLGGIDASIDAWDEVKITRNDYG